jgi:uncharacterized protein (TIGR02646 family)
VIKLAEGAPAAAVVEQLTTWQADVDAAGSYEQRVSEADRLWKARRSHQTMAAVARRLAELSSGLRRCNYCEDSAAFQIEHVEPKSFYPERTFVWDNMAFACGWCNGPKSNQHAVFLATTGEFQKIVRGRGGPVVPPPPGAAVLINPRTEDPSPFLHLDLRGTFLITARRGLSERNLQRANYTICVLRLNRDSLPEARRNAYEDYIAKLERSIRLRQENASNVLQQRTITALKRGNHRYVWLEMKRQRAQVPELTSRFNTLPEALEW